MNCYKQQALEIVNRLHEENRLDNSDYSAVHDGLSEIEPLRDRDEALEELWEQFGDIPMNPETECIEVPFMGWGVGIHREEIWHWFDVRHSKGRCLSALWQQRKSQVKPEKFEWEGAHENCAPSPQPTIWRLPLFWRRISRRK